MTARKSSFGRFAGMAMALGSILSPQVAAPNIAANTTQTQTREAIPMQVQAPRVVSQRLNFTNGGTGKDSGRILNQRQYRKWMRQCPHMRKSKKCRLK